MEIYGRNSVREAVISEEQISKVFIRQDIVGKENQELIDLIKRANIDYKFVPKQYLDKIAGVNNHQGFVARISDFKYSDIEEIVAYANAKGEQLFLVLLDGIEDPHNLGSIIRTCECAGVHGVLIEKNRACEVNSTVIKISSGAASHVKVAKVTNIAQTIAKLKNMGVWAYALEAGENNIYKTNLKGDLALIIGSEGRGVRKVVRDKCDGVISLPMFGKVNSLNASNATAISVYEALRQRKGL